MIYKTLSQLKERHNEIIASYRGTLPFFKRGVFFCLLRILLFCAWCYIWIYSGKKYLSHDYVYYDTGDTRFLIVPMLLAVIGFFVFKPYRIWTDRTYFGKIEKIEKQSAEIIKKNEKGVRVVVKRMHMVMYDGFNTLSIRKKSGRLVKRKVPNLATFDRIYDLDSSVSVVCGVKFPVPMNKAVVPEEKCFCTKCGSFEKSSRTRCSMCFTTLWYK